MTRNTKEVALISHRTGKLAEMPKALHQSEIGLAKDANRIFIGNAANTILANRNEFPYQNLEILTEYTELKNYFKYSYENNIVKVNGVADRTAYKEFLPIVIYCEKANPTISASGSAKFNGTTVAFTANDDINDIVSKINAVSDTSKVYATILPTSGSPIVTIVTTEQALSVEDVGSSGICTDIGFPTTVTYDIRMPERKVTEKLDDFITIADFDVRGDGTTNVSQKVYNALVEIYKNNSDSQFFRNVFFPAGTYVFAPADVGNLQVSCTFPMISNLHVRGEGIDRTIIKSTNTDPNIVLLSCLDSKLNNESTTNYGEGTYPSNVIIEDMTFETSSTTLCKLSSISNVTFNRVKFKGSATTTLFKLFGVSASYAQNITFNECSFEGGLIGIEMTTFVKNVNINNSFFKSLKGKALKIGDDSYTDMIYGVNASGNTFFDCASNNGETCVIRVGKNAQYVSIHQSQFDKAVIERTNTLVPYIDYTGTDRKNFCDTLDITTDTKKVLMFNFAQPQWKYLNYLVNQSGKVVLAVDGSDSDITADNGFNITETSTGINVKSVKTGNVTLSLNNSSDVTIGEGTDSESTVTGNIQIKKDIKLNNKNISNSTGNTDITLQTAPEKVLMVDETGATPYEQLVLGKDDAIPNVAYVNTAATDSFIKKVTYEDIASMSGGFLTLKTFDKETYGDNIHIKQISLNVRTPFYRVFEDLSKAATYQTDSTALAAHSYWYYKGDVVKDTSDSNPVYGVVKTTHQATGSALTPNTNIIVVPNNTALKSVKYAALIGLTESSASYNLTQTYRETFTTLSGYEMVNTDISANNKFGYTGVSEFVNGESYGGSAEEMVTCCERNYVFLVGDRRTFNYVDLHNTDYVLRKYDEGFDYIYDMDRNNNNGTMITENISSINFAGGTLKLRFFDDTNTPITSFTDKGQLNPGGELIVRVDYIRNEV